MTSQRVQERGSQATRILEHAWARLRHVIRGLPSAVIVPLDAKGRRRKWGHFAPSKWRVRGPRHAHEIAISPELFSSPAALLETMVREAAHARLYETDPSSYHVGGMGRDGYYHRHEFRDTCRDLGLECTYLNGRYGWTLTRWPDAGVPERYLGVARILGRLPFGSGRGVVRRVTGQSTPVAGQVRLRCACDQVRTIYVARAQARRGGIGCLLCGAEFRVSSPADTRVRGAPVLFLSEGDAADQDGAELPPA